MSCRKCCYFFVLLGLDLIDLIADWLVYADASRAERGLVYGPHEDNIVCSLLAFSIIGTLLFLFESVNLSLRFFEYFDYKPKFDVDLVSAIIIWLEDIPQLIINLKISLCREDAKSYFQLVKAGVILFDVAFRLIFRLVMYYRKYTCRECCKFPKGSRHKTVYRGVVIAGLVLNAVMASCVFVFTQTHRNPDTGDVIFQLPKTLIEDEYNDQRYFQNVSVFVHLPDFDSAHVPANNGHQVNWVRLMSINNVRGNADDTISYKYGYQKSATGLQMALWKRVDKAGQRRNDRGWELKESAQLHQNGSLTKISADVVTNPNYVYITFSYVKPESFFKRRIFGDIRYNIKVGNGGKCLDYDNITDDVNQAANKPIIHYYRTGARLSTTTSHLVQGAGGLRFFRNDGDDLTDVATLWKTGFGHCESSGSGGPTLHRDIKTGCD